MKKILQIIIFVTIIISCKTTTEKYKIDIKGDFDKVTTIKLRITKDSLGVEKRDTLTTFQTFYDNKKVKKTKIKVYINNEVSQEIETVYKYNFIGNLKKEVTTTKNDSTEFEVNYLYENNILSGLNSISELEDFKIVLNEKYTYDSNDKLIKTKSEQLMFNSEEKDTISFQINVFSYDSNENLIESDCSDKYKDYSNFKEYHFYDENDLLIKTININKKTKEKDSTIFKYKYDSLNNWIYRESWKKDSMIQIAERIIE